MAPIVDYANVQRCYVFLLLFCVCNFQPIRLVDPDSCYKFTYLMAYLTDLHLHCLQRQGIFGFSMTRVNTEYRIIRKKPFGASKCCS